MRLESEPSTKRAQVRSLLDVPKRPTKPAPETPINQAAARSVRRSTASGGRMTSQTITSSSAALMPCTAPMMNATRRGLSFKGEEINPYSRKSAVGLRKPCSWAGPIS
jgi:hypothetical protein